MAQGLPTRKHALRDTRKGQTDAVWGDTDQLLVQTPNVIQCSSHTGVVFSVRLLPDGKGLLKVLERLLVVALWCCRTWKAG